MTRGGSAKSWSVQTPSCPETQKVRFATREEAHAGAVARVNRNGEDLPLASYECRHCGGWHHTSDVGWRNSHLPTARKRRRGTVAVERVERALGLVVDAEAVAITALYEYPKGDPGAVLRAIRGALAEVRAVAAELDRDDLESPELEAALELLRPKLKALELLATGKVDFTE